MVGDIINIKIEGTGSSASYTVEDVSNPADYNGKIEAMTDAGVCLQYNGALYVPAKGKVKNVDLYIELGQPVFMPGIDSVWIKITSAPAGITPTSDLKTAVDILEGGSPSPSVGGPSRRGGGAKLNFGDPDNIFMKFLGKNAGEIIRFAAIGSTTFIKGLYHIPGMPRGAIDFAVKVNQTVTEGASKAVDSFPDRAKGFFVLAFAAWKVPNWLKLKSLISKLPLGDKLADIGQPLLIMWSLFQGLMILGGSTGSIGGLFAGGGDKKKAPGELGVQIAMLDEGKTVGEPVRRVTEAYDNNTREQVNRSLNRPSGKPISRREMQEIGGVVIVVNEQG